VKKTDYHRRRRAIALAILTVVIGVCLIAAGRNSSETSLKTSSNSTAQTSSKSSTAGTTNSDDQSQNSGNQSQPLAVDDLAKLAVKPKSNQSTYQRDQFGSGWASWGKCDTRERILARDLTNLKYKSDGCTVLSGTLNDPYTGQTIDFARGASTSSKVQIDHVVALGDAWATGAAAFSSTQRKTLANDDLELLAVDGSANEQKSDGDASEWLPTNQAFRCQYVARQIAVKIKYALWITQSEHSAMAGVLKNCPGQRLPAP
jgi:hypothetical protein